MSASGAPQMAGELVEFAFTGAAVRAAERPLLEAGRGPQLMRAAAWGLAGHVTDMLRHRTSGVSGRRVAALVGPGNNGGDALFALAFLRRRGVAVTAVPVRRDPSGAPAWHDEGARAMRRAGGRVADVVPTDADVVIDGILGTGTRGPVTLPEAARHLPPEAAVVACDVPTGVNADTGDVEGHVLRAERTVTFGAFKTGLLIGAGAAAAGDVRLVDIGLGPFLPTETGRRLSVMTSRLAAAAHPPPVADAHKYTRGLVGLAAGSARYPGAAVLSAGAALAGGAGFVHLAAPAPVRDAVLRAWPEVVASEHGPDPARTHAWVVGPGLGADENARRRLAAVLSSAVEPSAGAPGRVVVLDASALDLVGEADLHRLREARVGVVLTPHAGEWRRMLDRLGRPRDDEHDELGRLRAFAADTGAVVLLKGPQTLVAGPGGEAWLMHDGGPELAVAGTGDVLAGVIGAVCAAAAARGETPTSAHLSRAAAAAAWMHAHAGRRLARAEVVRPSRLVAAVAQTTARLWR